MQVDDGLPAALRQQRLKADPLQQLHEHHQHLLPGNGKFQVVLGFGVRKGAAGKEYPAHKGAGPLVAAQQLKGNPLRVQHGKMVVQLDAVGHVIYRDPVGQLPGGELFLPQGDGAGQGPDALHQLGVVLRRPTFPGQHLHFGGGKLARKDHQSKGLLVAVMLPHRAVGKDLIFCRSSKGGHAVFSVLIFQKPRIIPRT